MANKVLVTYDGANVWIATLGRGDNLKLLPGVNAVDAAQWARFAADNTVIKSQLKAGNIKVQREAVRVPDAPEGSDDTGGSDDRAGMLDGLKQREAVDLIGETFDVTLLEAWNSTAKDRKVLGAIAKQLDAINNGGSAGNPE